MKALPAWVFPRPAPTAGVILEFCADFVEYFRDAGYAGGAALRCAEVRGARRGEKRRLFALNNRTTLGRVPCYGRDQTDFSVKARILDVNRIIRWLAISCSCGVLGWLAADGTVPRGHGPAPPRLFVPDQDARPLVSAETGGDRGAVPAHAAHAPGAVIPVAFLAEPQPSSGLQVVSVIDGEGASALTWPLKADTEIFVRGPRVKLVLRGFAKSENVKIRIPGNFPPEFSGDAGVAEDKDLVVTLALTRPGELPIEYVEEGESPRTLSLVHANRAEIMPVLTSTRDGEFAEPVKLPSLTNVKVYGSQVWLEGELREDAPQSREYDIMFILFDDKGLHRGAKSQPIVRDFAPGESVWKARVQLPEVGWRETVKMLALTKRGDQYGCAAEPVSFQVVKNQPLDNKPSIRSVTDSNGTPLREADGRAGKFGNTRFLKVSGSVTGIGSSDIAASRIVLYLHSAPGEPPRQLGKAIAVVSAADAWGPVDVELPAPGDGEHWIEAKLWQGSLSGPFSEPARVSIRTTGPKISSVDPPGLLFGAGRVDIKLNFNRENPLDPKRAVEGANYLVSTEHESGVPNAQVSFDPVQNSATLQLADMKDGTYEVTVKKELQGADANKSLLDIFGNAPQFLATGHKFKFVKSAELVKSPAAVPGIGQTSGPYVAYPEFTGPRKSPPGFNPNDKVETRVVPLYYFRDAHRVAQIINRKVRSYNRSGSEVRRQLADRARGEADQETLRRQEAERAAITAAQRTREAENRLQQTEQQLQLAVQELTNSRRQGAQVDSATVQQLQANVQSFAQRADRIRGEIQSARADEDRANEAAQQAEGRERLAKEEQFRREVAAAKEDPDTFAFGVPESDDRSAP